MCEVRVLIKTAIFISFNILYYELLINFDTDLYIYCLFNTFVNMSRYVAQTYPLNNELEGTWIRNSKMSTNFSKNLRFEISRRCIL